MHSFPTEMRVWLALLVYSDRRSSQMADPHSFARRIVPDDHECLFSAIALLAEGVLKRDAAQRLRAVCADVPKPSR